MKNALVFAVFIYQVAAAAVAATAVVATTGMEKYSAVIYDSVNKPIFNLHSEVTLTGDSELKVMTYSDPSGQPALVEKTWLKGATPTRVEVEQKQLNATGTMEFHDGVVTFSKTADGKTKTDQEKVKGDLVTPGSFQPYVALKWNELMAGKMIDFRMAVWDRLETVGFSLVKIAETKASEPHITVRMKPSSFVIAAFVDPLEFTFGPGGQRVIEIYGRIAPKIMKDGKWKDTVAKTVYSYPTDQKTK